MSLESDLAPRLDLIRRLVRDRYAAYLHSAQDGGQVPHRVMLNEDGVIVPDPVTLNDPAHSEALLQEALERWREDWRNTYDAVSDLVDLVERFYVIDHDDGDNQPGKGALEDIWRELGIADRPRQQPHDRDTGHPPPEGGGSVYDELAYARYYVDEQIYNLTLDIRDEVRSGPAGPRDRSLPDNPGPSIELVSEHWDGPSAAAFFWNLCVPFDEAAGRQLEYVRELATVIHCFRVIRDRTTNGLRRIIDNCVRSLGGADEIEPLIPEESVLDGFDAGDAVNAAGLVIAGIGLCIGKGPVIIGVLGVGQALVSIGLAEAAKNEGSDDIDLSVAEMEGDGPPYPVIVSCQQAIGRVQEWLSRKDEAIGRGLEEDMSGTNAFNSERLWLKEPGGFSDDFDFDVNSTTQRRHVTAPIDALDRAGRKELGRITVGHYANAASQLSSVVLPIWVEDFLPRSYRDYNDAQGGLGHLLRTTKNNLEMWGKELTEIARDYEATDRDNAGNVDRAYN